MNRTDFIDLVETLIIDVLEQTRTAYPAQVDPAPFCCVIIPTHQDDAPYKGVTFDGHTLEEIKGVLPNLVEANPDLFVVSIGPSLVYPPGDPEGHDEWTAAGQPMDDERLLRARTAVIEAQDYHTTWLTVCEEGAFQPVVQSALAFASFLGSYFTDRTAAWGTIVAES